jgi:transmembrane sensor
MTSRKPLPPYDAPRPVIQAAAVWLARRDRGLTEVEQAEFDAWLRSDPLHQKAMGQLGRTFATFDGLRELSPHEGVEPDPDIFAPDRAALGGGRFFAVHRRGLRSFAAAGLAVAAVFAIFFWRSQSPTSPASWQYATAAADYERVVLVDGSTIELNGNTELGIYYTESERRVRLVRGEAHFHVAKNAARPFIVNAGSVAVRVIGTAFKIRLDAAAVEVLVTEGKVRVDPPPAAAAGDAAASAATDPSSEAPLLIAGQKLVVSTAASTAGPSVTAVTPEEIERSLAWQPRVIEFKKTSLVDVIAEFNRHSTGRQRPRIVIADSDLETLRIGGNFRVDQPEAFVRLLESSFGVFAERSVDVIALRKVSAGRNR